MMYRVMSVKRMLKQVLQSFMMAGIIPALMISAISNGYSKENTGFDSRKETIHRREITVLDSDGNPQLMELEAYITRVLLGEVSPEFHPEALKAQAVAARTYTLYCIEVLQKHSGGAVCTDYHCCQAYCEPGKYICSGGTSMGLKQVTDAVEATAGEVLTFGSGLICATYFASSGGHTEDAAEVWGKSYPYLQSVDSPGEEDCGYFSQQVTLSLTELQDALGVQLSGRPSSWFGMVRYTVGGGVDLMRIGGKLYTGVELRKLLKLRSTVMTVTATDDSILIDTKGYGHRVGMSQHGANAMAKSGSDYQKILAHYYRNTTLQQMQE